MTARMAEDQMIDALKAIRKTGGKPVVKCYMCDVGFQLGSSGPINLYCSEACRKKAYRLRKKQEKNNSS